MVPPALRIGLVVPVVLLALLEACGDTADPTTELDGGLGADGQSSRDAGTMSGDASTPADSETPKVTIGGKVVGLRGRGLVLGNGSDALPVGEPLVKDAGAPDADAGGTDAEDAGPAELKFEFPTAINEGASYAVTVATQPKQLAQTCTVASGAGQAHADVTDVVVTCTTDNFTVGGTVTGLAANETVTLKNNGGPDYVVAANGPFAFPEEVEDGSPYDVTIVGANGKVCTVTDGAGTVTGAAVSVQITCVDCGDGVVDVGEGCDDANGNDTDGCTNACAKGVVQTGGNALHLIEQALAGLDETTSRVSSDLPMGVPPASGIHISSNDGTAGPFPNYQPLLDSGGHVLLVGGSGDSDYRNLIASYLSVTSSYTWHQSSSCSPDWTTGPAHPITAFLPATYEFPNVASTYHMLHFTSAQASATILGRTCEGQTDNGLVAVRTYPSGGTFTYIVLDIGNYGDNATVTTFVRPLLRGWLGYVRSKR